MANISHEMRTPLTVMSSYAGLTSKEIQRGAANEKTLDHLHTIKREAMRLGNLVEKLKNVSLEKERQLALKDTAAVALLKQVTDLCDPICQHRHNRLFIADKVNDIRVCVNQDSVFQTLVNLIINANRHTSAGTICLDVQMSLEAGFAEISVADTGEGIEPDLLRKLFDRGVSKDGGSGLGLAICKDVIEEHGGTIWIDSIVGRGTNVHFTLPCSKGGSKHEKSDDIDC